MMMRGSAHAVQTHGTAQLDNTHQDHRRMIVAGRMDDASIFVGWDSVSRTPRMQQGCPRLPNFHSTANGVRSRHSDHYSRC
jgi:hypothetical protein